MENPDHIWLIAYNESRFRFEVINLNNSPKAFYGRKAINYLRKLDKQRNTNVDIGIMQINWKWHNKDFAKNPFQMLRPKQQIKFIKNKFKPQLIKSCGDKWVGCYHSKSKHHKYRYIRNIYRAAKVLEKHLKTVIMEHTEISDRRSGNQKKMKRKG